MKFSDLKIYGKAILVVIYFPIYIVAVILYYILRTLLAITYLFMLEPYMTYDILRYMFNHNKSFKL